MAIADVAGALIGAITSGLTGIITAVPNAIKDAFEALFFTTSGNTTNVSNMAQVLLVFGGITLAFGLTKLVYNVIKSKLG